MNRYIALLRGINVGGKNKIFMADLKAAFERAGFQSVLTYINSGNVILESHLDETAAKTACETAISKDLGLNIPVCLFSSTDYISALAHAPEWWNKASGARHDAFFVIPPMTTEELCARIGAADERYELAARHDRVIFWSAPLATFSRTRWSKISNDKTMHRAITVRSANTALKLAELVAG